MAKENFLSDYKQLPISVERIDLSFFLDLKDGPDGVEYTRVSSAIKLALKEDSWKIQTLGDLFLNGRSDIKLESLFVNKTLFPANTSSWRQTVDGIYLNMDVLFPFLSESNLRASEAFLEIVVRIKPQENTLLEGLYKSGGMFSTHCEAEGFRGITYFFDRPDILTI
jgi:aminopeptidase N